MSFEDSFEPISPREQYDIEQWELNLANDHLASITFVLDQTDAVLDNLARRIENLEAKRKA